MRTSEEMKERILLTLIEEVNKVNFKTLAAEPENLLPQFLQDVTNRIHELCQDEITFRRRF